jgi:hypothetical protein
MLRAEDIKYERFWRFPDMKPEAKDVPYSILYLGIFRNPGGTNDKEE